MKSGLLFLLKAALIALALFAATAWLRPVYWNVILNIGYLFFDRGGGLTLYYDSLDKFIPFTALLLATPRMPWLRKGAMLAAGLAVFIAIDVGAFLFTTRTDLQQTGVYNTEPDALYFWIWETYGRWLLPILLWLLTSYRYLEGLFSWGGVRSPASFRKTGKE